MAALSLLVGKALRFRGPLGFCASSLPGPIRGCLGCTSRKWRVACRCRPHSRDHWGAVPTPGPLCAAVPSGVPPLEATFSHAATPATPRCLDLVSAGGISAELTGIWRGMLTAGAGGGPEDAAPGTQLGPPSREEGERRKSRGDDFHEEEGAALNSVNIQTISALSLRFSTGRGGQRRSLKLTRSREPL